LIRLRCHRYLIAELGFAAYLELEIVVFFVCSDPEPVVMTIPLPSQGTVATADFDGVDFAFLGKAQRGMPWIDLEQGEILLGELLNVLREFFVTTSRTT
jgi:hypothetical protein